MCVYVYVYIYIYIFMYIYNFIHTANLMPSFVCGETFCSFEENVKHLLCVVVVVLRTIVASLSFIESVVYV